MRVMFQFRATATEPRLDEVCEQFDLSQNEVDGDFGVIRTDSREGLYVMMVDDDAARRLEQRLQEMGLAGDPQVGVFSNPSIATFGPPS